MSGSSDDKTQGIWSLLPSFDPGTDNIREYIEKVKFIDGICPEKDRPMLAPRLAMLCRGTAWGQVKSISAEKLTDKKDGVKTLLQALAVWEESAEMKTYELFEKLMYKTTQKADESTTSFVNRLRVALHELGKVDLKEILAFLMLRQSALGVEDKKRVLTMTGGEMHSGKIESAMRTLATSVLTNPSDQKKKVYPTNYVEPEGEKMTHEDPPYAPTFHVTYEDEEMDYETVEYMANQGDADALNVMSFEKDLEDMLQEIPDFQQALVSYQEARTKILERKKSRGFWPSSSKGRGRSFGFGKGFKKGAGKGGLLARISRTHCKICGEKGHWKAECPQRGQGQDSANLAVHEAFMNVSNNHPNVEKDHVIFENFQNAEELQTFYDQWEDRTEGLNEPTPKVIEDQNNNRPVPPPLQHPDTEPTSPMPREFSTAFTHHTFSISNSVHHARQFLSHRWSNRNLPNQMKVECLHSSHDMENIKTAGVAILDTGASRSVVGNDILPYVIRKMPKVLQMQIREKPSKVGFRFGNNQVTYSFKQVQIPIFTQTHKIWIVIEVVPEATPFLLSIQAMKKLGAKIDLETNHCYLSKIDRQLNLGVSKNGLYLVNMNELCLPDRPRHSAFSTVASRLPSFAPPPGLTLPSCDSNANSGRSHAHDQEHGGGHHGVTQDAVSDPDVSTGGSSTRSGDCPRQCTDPIQSSPRSPEPEGTDRAADWNVGITKTPVPKKSRNAFRNWKPIGTFGCIMGSGRTQLRPDSSTKDANACDAEPTNSTTDPIQSSQFSSTCNPKTGASTISSSERSGSHHCTGTGIMGKQEGLVGQDSQWITLCRSLRTVSGLPDVDHSKSQFSQRGNARLHHVHPSSRISGASGIVSSVMRPGLLQSCQDTLFAETTEELNWLKQVIHHMPKRSHRIDLLEVYTEEDSKLTHEVNRKGGKAKRFTLKDGDLSTNAGQVALLRMIFLYNPRNIWLSPECRLYSPWNRFNQMRGITSFNRVQEGQKKARIHLRLCAFICKIQLAKGDHCHVENPGPSSIWSQKEFELICRCTKPAMFDQCAFGLKHPETAEFMKKLTRVQTTSDFVMKALDQRFCNKDHEHHQIAGTCHWKGKSFPLSRFASFYPKALASAVAQAIMNPRSDLVNLPVCTLIHDSYPAEEENVEEPSPKRTRRGNPQGIKRKIEEKEPETIEDETWKKLMEDLRRDLPKSGVQRWDDPSHDFVRQVQSMCSDFQVQSVIAGKGRERYIVHPDQLPFRKTIISTRLKYEIMDLGIDDMETMNKQQQSRKAHPAHVMLCVFGRPIDQSSVPEARPDVPAHVCPEPVPAEPEGSQAAKPSDNVDVPASTWTSAAATISGPRFLSLSQGQQELLKKLHNNLGHPTAERLSKHLETQGANEDMIQGAKDYLCSSCAERRPPALNPAGTLKEARDFGERISIDAFEWVSKTGYKGYVIHIIDEATQFHMGKRSLRGSVQAQQVFRDMWQNWAGSPKEMMFDCGGEFIADEWKNFLQQENIKPILTAGPWQRGRVERHGGIIKEMLSRVDAEKPIRNETELDRALSQCFRAKNTLASTNGYSPEQAVLGRSTRLPASILGDQDDPSRLLATDTGPEADRFRAALELRTLARKAFVDSDNSQAIRRALLRKSRGIPIEWQCGQPCMFWDKRKAPNMLERGKWCGPAQVILVESKTIVWVSHMNRLLRCARDNLRPVSLRELSSHPTFSQQVDQQTIQNMAAQLRRRLQDRSGMFQFSDMSSDPIVQSEQNTDEIPTEQRHQPEEEPLRRQSLEHSGTNLPREPYEIPVPNTDSEQEDNESYAPTTPLPGTPPDELGNDTTNEVVGEQPLEGENQGEKDDTLIASQTEVIHNALIAETVPEGPLLQGDEDTLWIDPIDSSLDHCSFEFSVPIQIAERARRDWTTHEVFLTTAAKRSRSEVKYSTLSAHEKQLFDQAKQKELKCWLETSTVKKILRNRIHPDRIMTSRWILVWKPDPAAPSGTKAKARLVVRGFQDPEIDKVNTDSPTLGRDARNLLLQVVSSSSWDIQSFDITTAFLRGRSDGRQLAMEPVSELKKLLNMTDNEVCLLEGNAYGRVDAPLLFYKEFRKQLESLNFCAHPLDSCLFLLRNQQDPSKLDGILGTHVDDGIGGGNEVFEQALEKLQKVLPFGQKERRKFRFTGLDIEQLPDHSIRVSQGEYVHKIDPINVSKSRRVQKDEPANEQEVQDLRGLCGSLQYAAVHSRPDMAAKVSFLQKQIPKATVSTLLDANRVLNETKETSQTAIHIRPMPLREITFASFGDASFASAAQLRAQQGLFIVACRKSLGENLTSEVSPVAWNSKQIGRVVRSTLSAEAYSMSSSLDKLTWIRCMWFFILNPKFEWQRPEKALQNEIKALLITDCKSLYDLVTKLATPNCQEWRTTVEVMLIKEQAQGHTQCRWVSTAIMLADCLTKPMDGTFLRQILALGKFRIYDEELALKDNNHKKVAAKWLYVQPETHPATSSAKSGNTFNRENRPV